MQFPLPEGVYEDLSLAYESNGREYEVPISNSATRATELSDEYSSIVRTNEYIEWQPSLQFRNFENGYDFTQVSGKNGGADGSRAFDCLYSAATLMRSQNMYNI